MTPAQLRKLAELKEAEAYEARAGDGDGAFLPDMTEDEYQQYMRDETHGWKGFYNRVTGRAPTDG